MFVAAVLHSFRSGTRMKPRTLVSILALIALLVGAGWLLQPLLNESRRQWLQVPTYDRQSRSTRLGLLRGFAPDDVLIVEGVPALMDPRLRAAATVRLHVDASDAARRQRLLADYAWRGAAADDWLARLQQREFDEVPAARASATFATHPLHGD